MRIDTSLNQIDDTTTRVGKYISYFGREVQADKIRMTLVLIILLLTALFILGLSLENKNAEQ